MRHFWGSTKPNTENTPAEPKPDPSLHEILSKCLDRNNRWIEVADAKAAAILAFSAGALRFLTEPAILTLRDAPQVLARDASLVRVGYLLLVMVLLCIVVVLGLFAVIQAFHTLQPRVKRERPPGVVFFGDIAGMSLRCFQQQIVSLSSADWHEQLIEQVHTTAVIAGIKHQHVIRGIRLILWTICLGLLLYALGRQAR